MSRNIVLILTAFFQLNPAPSLAASPELVVLGIAQDGGYPHAGCKRDCCQQAWEDPKLRRNVACLAILDPESKQRWLIDATPDFRDQLRLLDGLQAPAAGLGLDGILLTHAHIGHYLGLAQLGREVLGAHGVTVYAMPSMEAFLRSNGPWDQLVRLDQIEIHSIALGTPISLNPRLSVSAIQVPHRDEYSETVGYRIQGPTRSALYIPDIDKWEKWDRRIEDLLSDVDIAFLDGTFYADGELPGRSMSEIPHPFIVESLSRFAGLPAPVRARVHFIHLNHTNPAMLEGSDARSRILAAGMSVAEQGKRFEL